MRKRLTMKTVRKRSRRIALAFGGALTVLVAASIPAFTTDSVAVAVAPNNIVEYASLRLVHDISDRPLTITRDGEPIATYPVAIGKDRNPTPRGEFSIRNTRVESLKGC